MKLKQTLASLAGLFSLSNAIPAALTPFEECLAAEIAQVYIETQVINYPIYINTFIESNTIININGGITINVNNAPTQLVTTVTANTTATVTTTM
jgi:hypothetical protein